MSQVLAAKAVPVASLSAKGTLAAARKCDGFAALFQQARKTSRQERRTNGRSDALEEARSRDRATRAVESAASEDTAGLRSPETRDAKPDRAERLQEATADARANGAEAAESDSRAAGAGQEAEGEAAPPRDGSAPDGNHQEGKGNEESTDHEFPQQPYIDAEIVAQTGAPVITSTRSTAGPAAGGAGAARQPSGASADVPHGAVPLSAAASAPGGSDAPASVTGSSTSGLAVTAVLQDAGADPAGASVGDKARSATGTEGPGKPAAGNDFQAILGQVGRARQTGQAVKLATTATGSNAESTHQSVEIDSATGPGDLARVLRSRMGARHSNLMIQLDPPELGRVRVDVRMQDEAMTLRFEAQTQAGHDALQGRLRELTGALEQQGVRLDRVEVEYRPPQDAQQDGQSPSQQGGRQWPEPQFTGDGGQWQNPSPTGSFSNAVSSDDLAARAGMPIPAEVLSASGVDVIV